MREAKTLLLARASRILRDDFRASYLNHVSENADIMAGRLVT